MLYESARKSAINKGDVEDGDIREESAFPDANTRHGRICEDK